MCPRISINETWNRTYWLGPNRIRPGANYYDAALDAFQNPDQYAVACNNGARLVMMAGIAVVMGRNDFHTSIMAGGSTGLLKTGNTRTSRSDRHGHWVIGDWGWIHNKGPKSPGEEGENIIFLGENRWWGNIPGRSKIKSLDDWLDFVRRFGDERGRPFVNTRRDYPAIGLQ